MKPAGRWVVVTRNQELPKLAVPVSWPTNDKPAAEAELTKLAAKERAGWTFEVLDLEAA